MCTMWRKRLSKLDKDISLIFRINITQHQKYLMNDLEILYTPPV